MYTNTLFSHGWRGALRLALIALLLVLNAAAGAPAVSADIAPPLLQFTAGGHVIGFAPTQVVLAAFDHALRVEFVGTAGVTPVAAGAEAAALDPGPTLGRAQPLGIVTYPELWRGVSVEYRASEEGVLKSTYTVAPGADAGQIRLRYNVPVEMQSDGSLRFPFGRGVMSESAPIAWQEIDGQRVQVPVAFRLFETANVNGQSEIGFRLGAYDPRYLLTIDPNYIWHTFYGSSSGDYGYDIAVDGSGNVYIAGSSAATWQGDGGGDPLHPHSGGDDIVVVKLNSAGAYQWHTFYGSSSADYAWGIAVDGSGAVYITGISNTTWQGDNNTSPLHAHSAGNNADIVALKLTSAGAYQWHTFYGSSLVDYSFGIAVDGSSTVYITGSSIATWQGDNNADPIHAHSGNNDIFGLKLTSAGEYQGHTFYGSSSADFGSGIAVDGSGTVYITGYSVATWQGDGNTDPLHAYSGGTDIVVVKLNSADGAYQWHTFYGSSSNDHGSRIVVDGSGNVTIAGSSTATWGSPLHAYSGGDDIVVLKLNSAGAYRWHTFYGSSSNDEGDRIAVDGNGNVTITGYSEATWGSPLHAYSGGDDIVALKLDSAGAYRWHTFYGSSSSDYGSGIAVDGSGNVYIAGSSAATWQGGGGVNPLHAHSGSFDIVAIKLNSTPQFKLYLPLILKGN